MRQPLAENPREEAGAIGNGHNQPSDTFGPFQGGDTRSQGRSAATPPSVAGQGLSLQMIANQLNAEGVPTLSSTGRWQKGTIGNLLAQAGNRPHARRAKSAGAVHGKLDLW